MSTEHPRRFVIAAAPSATAWLQAALRQAYGLPEHLPGGFDELVDRLHQAR